MKIKLKITGMTCKHCEAAVKSALMEVNGVTHVKVSLRKEMAIVEGEGVTDIDLVEAVNTAGYQGVIL